MALYRYNIMGFYNFNVLYLKNYSSNFYETYRIYSVGYGELKY